MPPPAIRPATIADIPFLWDMSFEAAFIPDDERAAWRGAPEPPAELVKYLDGWGRRGDAGVVAEDIDGTALGAAWYRLFAESDRGNGILAPRDVRSSRSRSCPSIAVATSAATSWRGWRRRRRTVVSALMLVDPANVRAVRLTSEWASCIRQRGPGAWDLPDHAARPVTGIGRDPGLDRFVAAQEGVYAGVLDELRRGRKTGPLDLVHLSADRRPRPERRLPLLLDRVAR